MRVSLRFHSVVWFAGLGVLTDDFRFWWIRLIPDRPFLPPRLPLRRTSASRKSSDPGNDASRCQENSPGYTCIESCRREASERREHDTAVVRHQYQRVVPERHVMATVDEDIEGELTAFVDRSGSKCR
jgi:hypothetical protein